MVTKLLVAGAITAVGLMAVTPEAQARHRRSCCCQNWAAGYQAPVYQQSVAAQPMMNGMVASTCCNVQPACITTGPNGQAIYQDGQYQSGYQDGAIAPAPAPEFQGQQFQGQQDLRFQQQQGVGVGVGVQRQQGVGVGVGVQRQQGVGVGVGVQSQQNLRNQPQQGQQNRRDAAQPPREPQNDEAAPQPRTEAAPQSRNTERTPPQPRTESAPQSPDEPAPQP